MILLVAMLFALSLLLAAVLGVAIRCLEALRHLEALVRVLLFIVNYSED